MSIADRSVGRGCRVVKTIYPVGTEGPTALKDDTLTLYRVLALTPDIVYVFPEPVISVDVVVDPDNISIIVPVTLPTLFHESVILVSS